MRTYYIAIYRQFLFAYIQNCYYKTKLLLHDYEQLTFILYMTETVKTLYIKLHMFNRS